MNRCVFTNILFGVFLLLASLPAKAEKFRVAAASSLQFVLDEVVDVYARDIGGELPFMVYGSSGNLYRQIEQGAPFEIFFSARGSLTQNLFESGMSNNTGDIVGLGRLVLLSSKEHDVEMGSPGLAITSQVISGDLKLAIANPAHAPYGRAAKQALESLQLWQPVQANLVNGEQVSQAARFVVSGAAPYGLVSLSLALSPSISSKTSYLLIEESLHEPIELRMVQLDSVDDDVSEFYNFVLNNDTVDEIFTRYGLR